MAFDNLKLEKGMYGVGGKSFTQVLEELDPSENYKGTSLEHLDAFGCQLKRFDIKVKGDRADCVGKFFSTFETTTLFPEYINRMIRVGMEEADRLSEMVATVTNIDSMDYRTMYSTPSEDRKNLAVLGEGASIPETNVLVRENLVTLKKRGRMLSASYEALRFQKISLFSVMLRQMGAHIQEQLMADAVDVLINGDKNANNAPVYSPGDSILEGTEGVLDYDALVRFWAQFHPYEMNTLVASPDMLVKILSLEEMKNPLAGFSFQSSGAMVSPLGAKLIRNDSVPAGTLVGLDNRYALEMIKVGDVTVEYDKLMDRQLERAAITCIAGFNKIQEDAVKVVEL